jgi:hypothetical protein
MPGAERAKTAAKGDYGIAGGGGLHSATVYHVTEGHLSMVRLQQRARLTAPSFIIIIPAWQRH